MSTDDIALRQHREERLTQFGRVMPGPMSGFTRLHKKAVEDGALSATIKEMMALAVSIAVGCEGCIAYHVHDTIKAGATRAELLETIGVGVMTLAPALRFGASAGVAGGPGTIYAAHALDVVEPFLAESQIISS